MKKIFILAMGLFVTGVANAQSTDKPITVGIKAGANFSNIIKNDGNNNFKTKYLTGFNAGVTVDVKILDVLAFTPELLYSTKGYKLESSFGDFTQTTSFIELPLLATVKLAGGLNLVAGPQVSFLLSTKNKFDGNFLQAQQTNVENDADRFKKSLVGGVIGFRYDINNKVGINGRYALDFQKNNENGTSNTPEYKNQVFQIGLGLKF
ncbi:PorT family protein [Pedobacter changchengzhani]|uniref:PorT family protein n=1 Tax=Pedobacter changchengzhani TaxID=2529274 RepID=A0A4R5MN06_9SPHI|nr:porin family protein [Pedobacter changchengzhani]TDG37104.1 PorT family protein [Pedobacter changchengzhani]